MSRLFHTLVVVGASISSAACGGESTRQLVPGEGGSGGAGTGGGGGTTAFGGSGANGGTGAGGSAPVGGTAAGGTAAGGAASGGSGGDVVLGGTGPTGGASGAAGLPEPGDAAQWDCSALVTERDCQAVLGTTAARIPASCPLDESRPRSPSDCAANELFTCYLAVTPSGETVLANCECQPRDATTSCWSCTPLGGFYYGEPAYCDQERKICACAYTGILR